jgi:hypothetical protein
VQPEGLTEPSEVGVSRDLTNGPNLDNVGLAMDSMVGRWNMGMSVIMCDP